MSQNFSNIVRTGTVGANLACTKHIALVSLLLLSFSVNGQDASTNKPATRDNRIVQPKLIYGPAAEFPPTAGKENRGGVVVISTLVDETGLPTDVKVTKSLSPDFDAKALEAVRQYRFEPALKDGKPVAKTITVEINFSNFSGTKR